MLKTEWQTRPARRFYTRPARGVAVIWIDWYAYHVARFAALVRHPELAGNVVGVELVGGIGVHAGLKFRESLPSSLPVETLFPASSWSEVKGWAAARAVWKLLHKLDPALVLVPGYYTAAGLAAAVWAKLNGRRTVLMTESTAVDHARVPWKEAFKGGLIRLLFDWAVAGGAPHRRYLEQLGFPRKRIARFYDVVDNEFFAERSDAIRKHSDPADFDLPPKPYFLYVGRLAKEKNISGLLASYLEYRGRGGDWPLVLVGDGPERASLEQVAGGSNYSTDIRFVGLKTTAELPQYYAFAGCFVLPSTREPWGLVANEALAAGLPLIVSRRCGCAADLLAEGENGYAFDPETPGRLTGCLSAIGALTEGELEAMGLRSRQIVAPFSPGSWAAEIARIARS